MYGMVIDGAEIVLRAQWLAIVVIVELKLHKKFLIFYENGKKLQISWNQHPTHPNSLIQQNEENNLERIASLCYTLSFNGGRTQ
jgi:hypothetical protein